jgi:hypothetical protein
MAPQCPDKWSILPGGRRGHIGPALVPRSQRHHGPARGRSGDGRLRPLRRHPGWTGLGLLIAVVAAATRFFSIGILPPSITSRTFAHATARTQLVVAKKASFSHTLAPVNDTYASAFPPRSYALADIVASPELTDYIARTVGVPASKIGILEPLWTELARAQQWANGPKRASEIIIEKDPYQISLGVQGNLPPYSPVIDVDTQAPNTQMAAKLATAVTAGLRKYVLQLQTAGGIPPYQRYGVSQLASVSVTPANTSQLVTVAVFVFLAVFVLWCAVVLAFSSLARDLRSAATRPQGGNGAGRSSYMLQDR